MSFKVPHRQTFFLASSLRSIGTRLFTKFTSASISGFYFLPDTATTRRLSISLL